MHPILAGIISGAVMGLGFDVLTVMALQRLRRDAPPWMQAVLRQTTFFRMVAPMALFTHAAWTFAGLVAGAVYAALGDEGRASGLGSPFLWYTLAVLVLASVYLLLTAVAGGRIREWMLPSPVLFAVTFGWLLPNLAG